MSCLKALRGSIEVEKCWPLILYVRKEREVIACQIGAIMRMTCQFIICVLKVSCVKVRIVLVENDSSSVVGFPQNSENFWQISGCVQRRRT